MMKKIVSLLLTLVMVLAAVSAFAAPKNISEIQGLPEFPSVPTMKVKSSGTTTTVTLDGPVSWLAVVRNWVWENLEFNESNIATYSTAGQKVAPGFGLWGWSGAGSTEVITAENAGDHEWKNFGDGWDSYNFNPVSTNVADSKDGEVDEWAKYWDGRNYVYGKESLGSYGEHVIERNKIVKHEGTAEDPDGYVSLDWHYIVVKGGSYDMDFAYDGETLDGVHVQYNAHGKLVTAAVAMTGQNFLGLDQSPSLSIVTFSTGTNAKGKQVVYISNITEEIDENTRVSADFAQNGKCLRIK